MEQITILDERYRLNERIGEGGMAEVYLGTDVRLGREVAIKILRRQYASDRRFLDRFLQEARAMAGFSHPNIVNVYDVGREDRRYYIVMEYVPGTDLRHLLKERGPLPVNEVLSIAEQIAQGVAAAHKKGIVHRDIKPGNVLITPAGDVKVADFGIARAISEAQHLTEPGVVWGTTAYLSPEQIRGNAATPASDAYSIGVVLYEMLAGRPPFQGEDRVAIALQHLHEQPPKLRELNPKVPPGVEYLVNKALSKAPEDRFGDAEAFARAISGYLRAGTETTVPQSAIQRPIRQEPYSASSTRLTQRRNEAPSSTRGRRRSSQSPRSRRAPATARPTPHPTPGIDWLGIMLGIVALLMVLGLVPLYALVYQRITGAAGGLIGVIYPYVFVTALGLL